jgi:hypothetical protein
MTFYNMMILEGFIAMVWAAGAMAMIGAGAGHAGITMQLADGGWAYFQEIDGVLKQISATSVVGVVCRNMLGSVGGIIVDGGGEFYTKAIARRFAFSANSAGCSFPGKSLVEATGSLGNFHVLSDLTGAEPVLVYRNQVISLIDKVLQFDPSHSDARKKILAVHASTRRTSNTLLLWDKVLSHLQDHADVTEVSLRNGEIYDCRGCSYEACLHFGENESCFYGGVITEQGVPAPTVCVSILVIDLAAYTVQKQLSLRLGIFGGKRAFLYERLTDKLPKKLHSPRKHVHLLEFRHIPIPKKSNIKPKNLIVSHRGHARAEGKTVKHIAVSVKQRDARVRGGSPLHHP